MAVRPWHVLELCAGAGGLGLGIDLAVPGACGVAYVEREAAAAATLVTRMEAGDLAAAPVWSDLATFDGRPWRGRVHCVASGDPCQPNSVAGKGLGADDERFLIDQVLRIVDEVRPLRLFRENVPGNAAGQLAALVGPLEEMGYRVECGIFSSAATGNSHGRKRLVVMADRADGEGWLYPRPWRPGEDAGDARGDGDGLADAAGGGCDPRAQIAAGQVVWLSGSGGPALAGDRSVGMDDTAGDRCRDAETATPEDGPRAGLHARGKLARRSEGPSYELVDATRDGRQEGRPESGVRRGRDAIAGAGGELADSDGEDAQGRRRGRDTGRREVEARHARLVGGGLGAFFAPGPGDPRWGGIIDADPFFQPALGRYDFWAIARRNLGLSPLVDAIGRRGGMARDLDAATAAAVKSEVRRIADAMADRVERLRQLGNGVDPVAAWDAWCNLDARHRARRDREAGRVVVMLA